MSVSILKTGIVKLGGTGVGTNLILNGNLESGTLLNVSQREGSAYWGNWGYSYASDRSIVLIDGKHWLHFNWSNDTASSYGGFYQDQSIQGTYAQEIKPNTYYTISGLWFATASLNCCYWLHMRSTQGGSNISQLAKDFTVTTEKQWFYYTFNSGSNSSYTINRYNLMIGARSTASTADVYITNIKMEEGQIVTPYIPNINDSAYVSNACGVFELPEIRKASSGRDWMSAECFYEI